MNLRRYPISSKTFEKLEKMRKESAPKGFKPMSQSKFIDKLLNGRVFNVEKKQKR